jgi:hypothetical protein
MARCKATAADDEAAHIFVNLLGLRRLETLTAAAAAARARPKPLTMYRFGPDDTID